MKSMARYSNGSGEIFAVGAAIDEADYVSWGSGRLGSRQRAGTDTSRQRRVTVRIICFPAAQFGAAMTATGAKQC
jgi:hypothetical protein